MKNPAVSTRRLTKALATHGILANRSGNIVTITSAKRQDVAAEILLPSSFPLEAKAAMQLLAEIGAAEGRVNARGSVKLTLVEERPLSLCKATAQMTN